MKAEHVFETILDERYNETVECQSILVTLDNESQMELFDNHWKKIVSLFEMKAPIKRLETPKITAEMRFTNDLALEQIDGLKGLGVVLSPEVEQVAERMREARREAKRRREEWERGEPERIRQKELAKLKSDLLFWEKQLEQAEFYEDTDDDGVYPEENKLYYTGSDKCVERIRNIEGKLNEYL